MKRRQSDRPANKHTHTEKVERGIQTERPEILRLYSSALDDRFCF